MCLSDSTFKYQNQSFPGVLLILCIPDIKESLGCCLHPELPLILRPPPSATKRIVGGGGGKDGIRPSYHLFYLPHGEKKEQEAACSTGLPGTSYIVILLKWFFFTAIRTHKFL